jgi:hypothetical protein
MISEWEVVKTETMQRAEMQHSLVSDSGPRFPLPTRQEAVTELSMIIDELKSKSKHSNTYWHELGRQLIKIIEKRLYKADGYHSFEAFCNCRLGYSRQHIYKLIKVTQFIDQLRAQAKTPEQQRAVQRLFSLGFTKLYLLQTMQMNTLEGLLEDGITIPEGEPLSSQRTSLELITVRQLKLLLAAKTNQSYSLLRCSANVRATISFMEVQAKSLIQFISQQSKETSASATDLQTIEKYAFAILEATLFLLGEDEEKTIPTGILALMMHSRKSLPNVTDPMS